MMTLTPKQISALATAAEAALQYGMAVVCTLPDTSTPVLVQPDADQVEPEGQSKAQKHIGQLLSTPLSMYEISELMQCNSATAFRWSQGAGIATPNLRKLEAFANMSVPERRKALEERRNGSAASTTV